MTCNSEMLCVNNYVLSPCLYESSFFIFRQYCNLVFRVKKNNAVDVIV